MKAIIVNRIGDFGVYFALLLVFYFFKTFDFSVLFSINYLILNDNINLLFFNINKIDFICFFLFLGTVGKSAQLGLHT
jgi:NADH-quinone oxidoreductase subunit L